MLVIHRRNVPDSCWKHWFSNPRLLE